MGIELFIAIFLGVIALALVAILIVFLIWFIKRKTPATQSYPNPRDDSPEQSSKTEFVGEYTVKLSAQDSGESWTKTVKGDIYLGRDEDCGIRLTDGSVSRKQCRISSAGQGLIITNLSETNKTILNGTQITGSSPLQSGDKLILGRMKIRVDYIQSVGEPAASALETQPAPAEERNDVLDLDQTTGKDWW